MHIMTEYLEASTVTPYLPYKIDGDEPVLDSDGNGNAHIIDDHGERILVCVGPDGCAHLDLTGRWFTVPSENCE